MGGETSPLAITRYCAEGVRGDATLRPDVPFSFESTRGGIKMGQTKGTKASYTRELPAVGMYSNM